MAILDRLKRLFSTGEVPINTSREITPVQPVDVRARLIADGHGRHDVIRYCREMYRTDPRAEGVLRMLARDTARSGFTVTVTGTDAPSRRAQKTAADLLTRLSLHKHIEDWIRLGARDGDLFLEPGIGRDMHIAEVTRKPTLHMLRLSDDFDRFADPARAFAYVDATAARTGIPGDTATYFPEFLMVHARWNHDSESRYGTPEFASGRGAWKRLTEGEIDVAVRRKTRAGVKYVHNLIGASEAAIEAYKVVNERWFNNPYDGIADLFINFEGGISTLDGDPHLGELGDITHHLQTWSASSAVPLELLAYGGDLNRDVLEDKKRQYDETLFQVREWAADQIVIPLLEREWLLAGILPETLTYAVTWPTSKPITPGDLATLVSAVNAMRASGWSDEAVWSMTEPFLPDNIDRDTLFDGMPAASPQPVAAAEAIGAVNRLIGRLEVAESLRYPEPIEPGTDDPDRRQFGVGQNGRGS